MDEIAAGGGRPSADQTKSMSAGAAEPHGPQLAPGDVLASRFTIVRFLARGGMGEVYEASDQHLQGKHLAHSRRCGRKSAAAWRRASGSNVKC